MKFNFKIISALALFLILLCSFASAIDWYVRPLGEVSGVGDGTSYDNAFDGLLTVPWGPGGVDAGDTLYVCGTHIHDMANKDSIAIQGKIYALGGNSDSDRITIDGNCPGDQGIVWRNYLMSHTPWNKTNYSNVWYTTFFGNHAPSFYFEDVSENSHKRLAEVSSIEELNNAPGSFYAPIFQSGGKIYVHTSDSSDPTRRIYFPNYGYHFAFEDNKHINVKNLITYGGTLRIGGSFSHPSHITFDNCKMIYGEMQLIDGMDYVKILNSEIAFASNGIYIISGTNNAASNYVFSNNLIHDIGVLLLPIT